MNGLKKLRDMWNENPLTVIASVAVLLHGTAKFIDAVSGIPSKRAYAKQRTVKDK